MVRSAWKLVEPGRLAHGDEPVAAPGDGEVVVEVAGCGVCHTDLGFFSGKVPTRAPLPLVLGHEIAGTVVAAGRGASEWIGRRVLVSAVIPCGECTLCGAGRGNVCRAQRMPGNDADGGFASHVTVPSRGIVHVPSVPDGYALADLAVIADAVTTPLQAVRRAGVGAGDLVVVVGTGGIGSHAVQIAAAAGARVVAVDIDARRLALLRDHGAAAGVDARELTPRQVRDDVRDEARRLEADPWGWKIFECSGTTAGQETAFALLGPAATLAVVGYAPRPVTVHLSRLMAFDADAFGSWGCPPELYPEALDLVASGEVDLAPFVRRMPMEDIERAFELAAAGSDPRRIVLTP